MSKIYLKDIQKACDQRYPLIFGQYQFSETSPEITCVDFGKTNKDPVHVTVSITIEVDKTEAKKYEQYMEAKNHLLSLGHSEGYVNSIIGSRP